MMRKARRPIAVTALPVILALSACGISAGEDDVAGGSEPVGQSTAALIESREALSIFAAIIDNANLDSVFEGPAPYTLLAPVNTAFQNVDDEDLASFTTAEMSGKAASLVLAHIIPGHVSIADLREALDASQDGGVTMRSMDGNLVLFRKGEGKTVTVAHDTRPAATVTEDVGGTNGGLLMIDTPLVEVSTGLSEAAGER